MALISHGTINGVSVSTEINGPGYSGSVEFVTGDQSIGNTSIPDLCKRCRAREGGSGRLVLCETVFCEYLEGEYHHSPNLEPKPGSGPLTQEAINDECSCVRRARRA